MGENELIQALGVPLLLLVVSGVKRLAGMAGVTRDVATPILTALLGVVYVSLTNSGAIVAGADVATGIGVGGTAALVFKVLRAVLGMIRR